MSADYTTDPDYVPGAFKIYDHAAKMAEGYHFTIDARGRWYCHDPDMAQGPLQRKALARLFADKGLKRDDQGNYWLSSPQDSYAVAVEDTPFTITHVDFGEDERGERTIDLYTNFGVHVPLDDQHTLTPSPLHHDPETEIPYVTLDNGMPARLSRRVFYVLAEEALHHLDGMPETGTTIQIRAYGVDHPLGRI